jgi:hypothetical protein
MRSAFALILLFASAGGAWAQKPLTPEQCLNIAPPGGVTVTHAGKTYRLATEACKAEFLSDPERFAQLYDALLELRTAGTPLPNAPSSASLVPS